MLKKKNFNPSSILDIGCGEGEFLNYFSIAETRTGIDFSSVAIENAKSRFPQIDFILGTEDKIEGTYDLVTSIGVIEHTNDPAFHFSKLYNAINKEGSLIIICPNHCNTRGIIWQTLSLLFDVPMSLADRHVISLDDVTKWTSADDIVKFYTFGNDVSMRHVMINDLKKRLTNALSDAKMDNSKVDTFLLWLENNYDFFPINEHSGWLSVFIISKKRSV